MKNLTIYDVYVEMQDQAQCDRMLQLCKDYNLPYWHDEEAFIKHEIDESIFSFIEREYWVTDVDTIVFRIRKDKTEVTEEQFIQMLKDIDKKI